MFRIRRVFLLCRQRVSIVNNARACRIDAVETNEVPSCVFGIADDVVGALDRCALGGDHTPDILEFFGTQLVDYVVDRHDAAPRRADRLDGEVGFMHDIRIGVPPRQRHGEPVYHVESTRVVGERRHIPALGKAAGRISSQIFVDVKRSDDRHLRHSVGGQPARQLEEIARNTPISLQGEDLMIERDLHRPSARSHSAWTIDVTTSCIR